MMPTRLLITGSRGQLAQSLRDRGALREIEIVELARPELDLSYPEKAGAVVANALERVRPTAFISAAAYTAVDRAEDEEDLATVINSQSVGEMAKRAAHADVPFIHISTDYVFDGTLDRPYRPDDPVAPLGAYGRSKMKGEVAVRESGAEFAILRTAWVTSPFGSNFVKTMLRLAGEREVLQVVDDQIGSPTSSLDLADTILTISQRIARRDVSGLNRIYHAAGKGEASWADVAELVMAESARLGGPNARIERIPSSQFPTKAPRPRNSRLDSTDLERAFETPANAWETAQRVVVRGLLEKR